MTEMQASTGNGKQHAGFDTADMIKKTRSALSERLEQQPYIVLGAAAAVGYILAAGVPRPVMSYLLRYGMKTGLRTGLRTVMQSFLPQSDENEEE